MQTLALISLLSAGGEPATVGFALEAQARAWCGVGVREVELAPGEARLTVDLACNTRSDLTISGDAGLLRRGGFRVVYGDQDAQAEAGRVTFSCNPLVERNAVMRVVVDGDAKRAAAFLRTLQVRITPS
jgi:hypothetical protein